VLGEVDYEAEILNGSLIDGPDRIVDEAAGGQDGESEDFSVMGLIFIEGSDSFSIDHDNVDCLAFLGGALDGSSPAPETLGAGIHRWPNPKAIASVEEDAVEQVGFACSIESSH
jgi:hypothetical protein